MALEREIQKRGIRIAQTDTKDSVPLVGIAEFVDSADYLSMGGEVWPGIKSDLEAMSQPGIIGAIIEDGIGGGKSYRVAIKLLYDIYRLAYHEIIRGENPRRKFDLDPESMISAANVSLNAKQAKKVVFGYISTFVDRSPWFTEYMPRDKTINSELRFLNRNYSIFPGHSNQSSVIGLNLFSCVIDEANFFTKAESSGSSGIEYVSAMYDAIESRIRSRFEMDGFLGVISSRRIVTDFTARKRAAIQKDSDFADRYFTPDPRSSWWGWPDEKKHRWGWKFFDMSRLRFGSGDRKYDDIKGKSGLWVPQTLWGNFATNPEGALRDHASIPSEAVCPFIRRRDKIVPDFESRQPVRHGVRPTDWLRSGLGFDDLVVDDFFGDPEEYYHFHIDLAEKWDACGISIARNSGMDEVAISEGRRPEKAALIDIEFLIQVKAPVGGEIEFAAIRRILYWLRDNRGFRFRQSSYDGYQSTDSVQILNRRGFTVEKLSVDRTLTPYITLKDTLYEGRLFFPPAHGQTLETEFNDLINLADDGDPMAIFQVELVRLELVHDKKVDHPKGGSKDLADAVCGSVSQATRYMRTMRK